MRAIPYKENADSSLIFSGARWQSQVLFEVGKFRCSNIVSASGQYLSRDNGAEFKVITYRYSS